MKSSIYVIPAGALILACLGVAYAWGVFLIPLTDEFGWGRADVSLAVSILLFIFPISMILAGVLEKRFGARLTVTIAGLLVSTGWILARFSESLLWLYLSYGLLVGIGTGLGYMPSLSTGLKCFPDKKGLVAGTIVFGFGFGAAFLAPLANKLIADYGWRATMMFYGISFGVIIVSCAQFLKTPPKAETREVYDASVCETHLDEFSPLRMIRTLSFKLIFTSYLVAMISGMMVIGHIKAFGEDLGFMSMSMALALSILAIANGIGRILFGWLSDRVGQLYVLYAILFALGSFVMTMPNVSSLNTIYVLSFLIGLCFGGFLSVFPAMTSDFFGLKNFSVNYGIVSIGYGSGCFLGPWLGGYIHDMTGSYDLAFFLAGCLTAITAIVMVIFLRKDRGKR